MISQEPTAKQNNRSILWFLAAGIFLLFYLAGAFNLNNFEIDNWSYIFNRDVWGVVTGNLSKSMMLYFDPQQVSSIMWKVFFLLPALLCASIWICLRFDLADKARTFFARLLQTKWCLSGSIGLSFIMIIMLIVFVTKGRPLIDDEYAYIFQAQTYLTGQIAMPPPPAAKSFFNWHILIDPVWTGRYLFGHPAFLAIGLALGSPYMATVAMSLASLVLLFMLGARTGSKGQAAVATWLVAVSPWFWFVSASLLSNISTLFLFLITTIAWTSFEKRPTIITGMAIGLCMGWSFAVRPLTAVLLAIPFGYLTARNMFRDPKGWLRGSGALMMGGLAVVGLVLLYNKAITGDLLLLPFTLHWPGETIGFGWITPVGHPTPIYHTPLKGIMNLAVSAIRVNSWFLGWPVSFLPIIGLLAIHYVRKASETEPPDAVEWNSWDGVWLAVIAVFCIGHIAYYGSGVSDTGPVYYYELLAPLSLLSAKGILCAHRLLVESKVQRLKYLVPVFCVVATIGSFVFFVPEKACHNQRLSEIAYRPFVIAEKEIAGKALVFVGIRPLIGWLHNRPQPSPGLDDRILFLRLLDDAANEAAIKAFPDRKPYRLVYKPRERDFVVGPYLATK